MLKRLFMSALLGAGAPALADETDQAAYVEANLVWIFYHEVAHALIHELSLPVLGREEDAADTLAAVLIDYIWEPDSAIQIAWYQALGWYASAQDSADGELAHWGVHGHDMQRFYNHVCLWYGANPSEREDFAETFELPEARAEGCADEYALAHRSWFTHLESLSEAAPGDGLVFFEIEGDFGDAIIAEEVRTLNSLFEIPGSTSVAVEPCGEPNAFYVPGDSHIIICREYVDYLWQQAEDLDL